MISILGFGGESVLLLGLCMVAGGVLVLGVCGVASVCGRLRARRTVTPAPVPLPRRRVPIDPETLPARIAQLDGVLAEIARTGGTSGYYAAARLITYEAELSHLLELALELDENLPAPGPEGGTNADV
jgi:hypothetical protein